MAQSHRLGFQGQWGLSDKLLDSANKFGLVIEKKSLRENAFKLEFADGAAHDIENLLPPLIEKKEYYKLNEIKAILGYMARPVEAIAQNINSISPEETRKDLHAILRFASAGLITPQKIQLDSFDTYHEEHDDECEDVAQDMEEEAAWRHDNELSGNLLPGLRFSRTTGKIKLSIHHDHVEGAAQQELKNSIFSAIKSATGHDLAQTKATAVYLSAKELDTLCRTLQYKLDVSPELLQEALNEEQTQATINAVSGRFDTMQSSKYLVDLATLKPAEFANTPVKMANLSIAADALQNFIEMQDVQRIWKKYNITKRNNPEDIHAISDRLGELKTAIAHFSQNQDSQNIIFAAEAIAAEFRDTIAFGRELSGYIASTLPADNPEFEQHRAQWEFLENAFAKASMANVAIARDYMDDPGRNVSHYLGRHIGTEGIDYVKSFNDFVDDFGGEVVEFVKKNPVLSVASVVALYYMMNSGGGGAEMIIIPDEFKAAAVIDPITGMPLTTDTPQDIVFKQCHWHSPVSLPFFEHCLFSNQALSQLEDAYALMKAPLSMILDAPEGGVNFVESWRGVDAPAFTFSENFSDSLKNAGDFYFVANGYQNLAHAPWFGIAAAMGWKLGAVEAMKRTSFLITPLVDAGYSLALSKPMIVAGSVSAAAYGYSLQGLSGAVSGAVMGAVPGWAAHSAYDYAKKIPELSYFKNNNIAQSFTEDGRIENKITTLIDAQDYYIPTETLSLFNAQPEGYKALQESNQTVFDLKIGGVISTFTLDAQSCHKLETALTELLFTLETQSEKIGIEDDQEHYKSLLQNKALTLLAALQDYKNEPELETSGFKSYLQKTLQSGLGVLVGAELKHFGRTQIMDAMGIEMTRRQEGEFSIIAQQTLRNIIRNDAHRNDVKSLRTTFHNAVKSTGNFKAEPLLVSLSLGYKAASAGRSGLRMAFREAWYQACARFSDIKFQWNKVEPSTKGHIIGAGLTVTAAAIGTDMSPQIGQAVQDTLGQGAYDGLKTVSGAAGHGAGAGTATGLFSIYNFGEDHMVVHVGLGYLFILASAGVKNLAYKPVKNVLVKPAVVLGQGLTDIAREKFDIRIAPAAMPMKNTIKSIRDYLGKARNYDTLYPEQSPE